MQINYYGYYLFDASNGKSYQVDLSGLLAHFASPAMLSFRKTLTYNSDNVFPLPFVAPTYYFVQSRDNEIIKAVNKAGLTQKDIQQVLQGDSIGFASYVHMQDCWFGIATKVLSPRVTAFGHAMNKVLEHLGSKLEFQVQAFTDKLQPSAVASLDHVGAVSIHMDAAGTLAGDVLRTLTGNGNPPQIDVGQLQIRLVPAKRKSNLKQVLRDVAGHVPSNELAALDARAKLTAADHMKDIFLVGSGGIKDFIPSDDETKIPQFIAGRSAINSSLTKKVAEFKSNAAFTQVGDPKHLGLNW